MMFMYQPRKQLAWVGAKIRRGSGAMSQIKMKLIDYLTYCPYGQERSSNRQFKEESLTKYEAMITSRLTNVVIVYHMARL